jgi:cobalt-zinc-cadmium efflux system membrane fusion protein
MSIEVLRSGAASTKVLRVLPWAGMGLCLAMMGGHLMLDTSSRSKAGAAPEARSEASKADGASPQNPATTVALSDAKLKAAKITTERARIDRLATELGVPGRIEVNADRNIAIRPRAAGVIREVHVVLGQDVRRGDALVTLDSPDVGTARLNLRARQRELNTARVEAEWKSQVAATVALLIPEIRKGTDPSAIEKEFGDKPLGAYRASLLQSYAEFDIAAHEEEKTAGLRTQEVIGEHPALVARHTREGLQAKLYAQIEQAKFDAAQEKRLADQRLRRAESEVIDAAQRLRILGVSENIRDLIDHSDKVETLAVDEDVTIYRITSPFDGTITKRDAVTSQKADANDVLFTITDLKTVWVTASIAESDVASVPRLKGGTIRITAPAYPARVFTASLLSVGAMVDPQTRTVPILAQTDNHDGLLKPGMFVRILLDSPTTELALTVPHSAVVEIEGKSGVFIPAPAAGGSAPDHKSFTFHPIQVAREAGDRVVIKSGLKEGESVVAGGAYQLKAELILQNQVEED